VAVTVTDERALRTVSALKSTSAYGVDTPTPPAL
jgi:hypothetical protein